MTTQAVQSPAFPRFRGGFGKSSRTKEAKAKTGDDDDDWVIPYNGPYEAPPPPRRPKARDSWGDPLEDYADDDSMLDARELHLRYGGHNDFNNAQSSGGSRPVEEERKGRTRDRSFSVMSGRTTSSGALDPNRASLATNRRSTVSSSLRPPVPSYINLDSMGGVGESPVPHIRNARDNNRISLASIFGLGGLVRKTASSPALSVDRASSARKGGRSSRPNTSEKSIRRTESPQPRRSTSTDSRHSRRPYVPNESRLRQTDKTSLTATDEEDYYNSYYSTLIAKDDEPRHHPLAYSQQQSPNSSLSSPNSNSPRNPTNVSRQNSTSTTSAHPYAYVFPQLRIPDPPRTAPPVPTPQMASAQVPSPSNYHPPRLTFTTATGQQQQQQGPNSADAAHPAFSPRSAGARSLRSPSSTPDLRIRVPATAMVPSAKTNKNHPGFSFPKGKDKWLSAETWCDALLFPRPRLKLKQDPVEGPILESSGRIVSPPSTPLGQDDFGFSDQQQRPREPGFASRVLAHSRSMVDLNKGKKKAEDIQHPLASSSNGPHASRTETKTQAQSARPPRPKSFAQDDLALPTPTPSLARVLLEGEMLETQRQAWQKQAANSWGNKRARSVSRTRAKSLTKQGRQQQAKHQHQSSMEYIAARACLGSQPMTPVIIPAKPASSYFSDATTTTMTTERSRGSHFRGDSFGKTTTSSKTHSKGHSRNESWGKSAVKMAKNTVICGHTTDDEESSIIGDRSSDRVVDLEGALKRNDTRVIRLADPAHIPVDRGLAVHPSPPQHQQSYTTRPRHTPSPADSRLSDSKVGIALGTPPEETSDYIPNHPYAQGGLSFTNTPAPPSADKPPRPADYAGPHPSVVTGLKPPQIPETVARHKLPPHMVLHPYAQQRPPSNRDSYLDANGLIGQYRSEDATPHPSKMWAQLSPGVVREVLPEDLKYSPFLPDSIQPSPDRDRQSIAINDMVGLGEALVNATRYGPGGGSQDHGTASASGGSHAPPSRQDSEHSVWEEQEEGHHGLELPEFGYRPRRNGFMDFSSSSLVRPNLEDTQKPSDPSTMHNHASSQLEYLPTPPTTTEREPSTAETVESSPPESPRPLGSPHDLEGFQDLFYRPNPNTTGRTPREAALPETPSPPNGSANPWDLMPNRRTGNSSLTSLARQLTDEFEAMALERLGERFAEGRSSSQFSQSPTNSFRRQTPLRRPTDSSLQFVFEEVLAGSAQENGARDSMIVDDHEPIHAFQPSETLPEDVQSSRASSFIEGTVEDDPTAVFRVGRVESVSTPPTISSSHHLSAEQSAFVHDQERRRSGGLESPLSPEQERGRVSSSLQPPTEATRSSYMTTSTLSRMSGLSDFPTPPKDDYLSAKHHVSMLSSYFNEAHAQSDAQAEGRQSHLSPVPPTPQEELGEEDLLQHVTFGVNQNAATVAEGLSSQSPPPPNVPAPPF
ncbi:hypothetical protein CVT26_014084 [Gymnopilus dilepis]|uniref:Uncharacterized protein n=1 Tax=Gymnopilus dilepis TaxID=231916 RepID=A0A409VX83_9AGAR|nr:hypothetical protein CVT26_014084 [Gymnopilus dilepis]